MEGWQDQPQQLVMAVGLCCSCGICSSSRFKYKREDIPGRYFYCSLNLDSMDSPEWGKCNYFTKSKGCTSTVFSSNGQDAQPNKLRIPHTVTSEIHISLLLGALYQSEPKKPLTVKVARRVFQTLNHGGTFLF